MTAPAKICWSLSALALLASLSGCIPIPYPIPPLGYERGSRHNLTDSVPAFIVEGQTTRAEVLFHLGEPDGSVDDRSFIYTSAYRKGGAGSALLIDGLAGLPAGNAQRTVNRRLTILFDDKGVVSSARIEMKSCWRKSSTGDVVQSMFGKAWNVSPPCLDASPDSH